MLVNAMEISKTEGSFRITCEHVLRVLRTNKNSLLAVLEAFIYDPLVSMRLVNMGLVPENTIQFQQDISKGSFAAFFTQSPNSIHVQSRQQNFDRNFPSNVDLVNFLILDDPALDNYSIFELEDKVPLKVLKAIYRVADKLTGKDFSTNEPLDHQNQVSKLIEEATEIENLCQCYIGWYVFLIYPYRCPFW